MLLRNGKIYLCWDNICPGSTEPTDWENDNLSYESGHLNLFCTSILLNLVKISLKKLGGQDFRHRKKINIFLKLLFAFAGCSRPRLTVSTFLTIKIGT